MIYMYLKMPYVKQETQWNRAWIRRYVTTDDHIELNCLKSCKEKGIQFFKSKLGLCSFSLKSVLFCFHSNFKNNQLKSTGTFIQNQGVCVCAYHET